MTTVDAATVFAATSAMCAVVIGGVFLYINQAEENMIKASKKSTEEGLRKLQKLEEELKERESKLQEDLRLVEENRAVLKELEESLKKKSEEIEEREAKLAAAEAEAAAKQEEKPESEEEPVSKPEEKSRSDADKRRKMIEDELTKLIKEANENELEEPFDEDSEDALRKAAHKICYLKKYYDVMKDEFIYFPSVIKTIVDYTLLEEAEKFYYEEEDEFPQDLSIGLRSVATMAMAEDDDDVDEEYMSALAQDVEI
mmetsp:Transcript_25438/g.41777  ORF Transcript_25438/g.41777 Transcript_25438/m.41777 type:complete len:256 (-) Transcript_25438:847-1614(-)